MKKAMLNFADRLLSGEQMKKVRGGCTNNTGRCSVRCDENSSTTITVPNCDRGTVEQTCKNVELSKTVCICG